MGVASKYWKLVRIDATGRRKEEEIAAAKEFLNQLFPEPIDLLEVDDIFLQRHLWDRRCQDGENTSLAETCLRCFISHQIEKACVQLENQFGSEYGFSRSELFRFVLDDYSALSPNPKSDVSSNYKSLASEILHTFEPTKSNLASWTNRMVKHQRDLNGFLLERGVYLISDWAILNDTNPKQLQRIFSDFHGLTNVEIEQASILLESYHAVYRRDRLKMRRTGGADLTKISSGETNLVATLPSRSRCQPPVDIQLRQISQYFGAKTNLQLGDREIMNRLQSMAEKLREYRILVRGGLPKNESLDSPENISLAVSLSAPVSEVSGEETDEKMEFLRFYRTSFMNCLDIGVKQAIDDRVTRLQRQKPLVAEQFILALDLFHCQERSMAEIAALLGLQAQYQVTRLLKLKEFRADVRQYMLKLLRNCILDKAKVYANPESLEDLEREIETFLEEQINQVIQQAEAEASTAKKSGCKSLFSERVCHSILNF